MSDTKEVMTLKEAAIRMGRSPDQLAASMRYCTMNGLAIPIGFAVPPSTDEGKWAYIIPRTRFEKYMSGIDMTATAFPPAMTSNEIRETVAAIERSQTA